jgi:ClpX C4-type zinc finger protein
MTLAEAPRRAPIYCSFCGGESGERDVMFAAALPNVHICDQCVDLAAASVAEWRVKNRDSGRRR